MDYNEERQTDFDLDIPEDRLVYDQRYIRKLKELTDPLGTAAQDEIIDELQNLKYDPSNNPEQDCELNYLRSKNIVRQKSRLDSSTESYLRFQAETSGRSLAEVKREYRKTVKKGRS